MSNEQKHSASDYESEGRRFESCRAHFNGGVPCGIGRRTLFGLGLMTLLSSLAYTDLHQ